MPQPTLPHEVVEIILSQHSQKSLLQAATVCKSWYWPVQCLLYQSVNLYSTRQHERFVNGLKANNNRVTDDNMKNGLLVRELILHTSDILMDQSEVDFIKNICPLITILRRLPVWHEDKSNQWIPENGGQLTDIRCFVEELEVLPSLIKSLPLFPFLVNLEIKMHYIGPRINITWMETINDQCPRLESLGVDFMSFDFVDGDNTANKNDWKPSKTLQALAWSTDRYLDPIWYTYLAQKYPKLTDLSLTFNGEGVYPETSTERINAHKKSIFNMVTSFQYLTTFNIFAMTICQEVIDWYPWRELANWIGTEEAKRIKKLRWRMDPQELGFDVLAEYLPEPEDFDLWDDVDEEDIPEPRVPEVIWAHNPLGNIMELEHLALDVPPELFQQLSNFDNLVLENISTLELFYSRSYHYEHMEIDTVLNACPNVTVLGLCGIYSSSMDMTTTKDKFHHRLSHLRLQRIELSGQDYMTHLVNRCPNLSTLQLNTCLIVLPPESYKQTGTLVTIDAPDHSFELVEISGIQYNGDNVDVLRVKQSSQNGGVAVAYGQKDDSAKDVRHALHLNCWYAETAVFKK
ncbi:hypothetical protein BC941DRAFT_468418 [Chlamydoabsidia padenii]|nr:hypothetical protein BC941DRAFT_468418 [Chlamydoabsidia padenii]